MSDSIKDTWLEESFRQVIGGVGVDINFIDRFWPLRADA